MSQQNLMDFGDGSSSDGEGAFTGGAMQQVARVSFDPHSSQVVGWDSIWKIIDAEEKDKSDLVAKLNAGVGAYVSNNLQPGPAAV